MPPLDDQLRAALHGRAATLTPLADPFAGVERRARGLRRRRAAASVAGTALAVLAVVGVVPLLAPGRGSPAPDRVATSPGPTQSTPSPAAEPERYDLDPDAPWAYRGDVPFEQTRGEVAAAWQAVHPDSTRVQPLFGNVDEPGVPPEVVVVSRAPRGDRWGVLTQGSAGWTVAWSRPLERGTAVLVALLPGGDERRVLALTSPEVDRLELVRDPGDREVRTPLQPHARGVGSAPMTAETPSAEVRGLVEDRVVAVAPLPDAPRPAGVPANVVDWPAAGTPVDQVPGTGVVLSARAAYAAGRPGVSAEDVREKVLVAGREGDVAYLLGQFWAPGDTEADTFAVVVRGRDDVEPQLYRPLSGDGTTDVVALQLPRAEGAAASTLVVVERPGLGLLSYSPDGAQPFVPRPAGGAFRAALFSRSDAAERAGRDQVRVVSPARGPRTYSVAQLLCGKTSCG